MISPGKSVARKLFKFCKKITLSGFEIARRSKEIRETSRRVKNAAMACDVKTLEKLLFPENNRAFARSVLMEDEERMITHRLIHAGNLGFAVDRSTLQRLMSKIGKERRRSMYRNHLPSLPMIRRFRASN